MEHLSTCVLNQAAFMVSIKIFIQCKDSRAIGKDRVSTNLKRSLNLADLRKKVEQALV